MNSKNKKKRAKKKKIKTMWVRVRDGGKKIRKG
jgi:hypothetical protein